MIRTVFFDWDYTLAYTYTREPYNTGGERLAKMFALANLPYSQEEIEHALELYDRDVAAGRIQAPAQLQKRREIAGFYRHLFNYLGEDDTSWSTRLHLYRTYALLPTHLYEDSRSTLILLQQQGYKLGIITNHSASARPVIESMVGDLVPAYHILISEEEGVHKPTKTIFKRAAARLRTRPTECVLVGDNLKVDAVGATAAGDYGGGIWLSRNGTGEDTPLPEGVLRISSLNEVPSLLSQMHP